MNILDNITYWLTENSTRAFYLLFLVAFLVNRLPFVGVFFRTLNTVLHETGHAVGAMITSGEVVKIEINTDTSGLAQTKATGKLGAIITTSMGYPFAALMSSAFLIFTMKGYHMAVAIVMLSIVIIDLMLFVRNTYGILWLVLFSTMIMVTFYLGGRAMVMPLMLFTSMMSFTETIASTMVITALSFSKPGKSGDMHNLEKSTGIPAALWSLVNLTVVGIIIYYTIVNYFPSIKMIF